GGEEVGHVDQGRGLPADGADHCRVAVAQCVDGDPGEQVQVAVAVGIPDIAALSARQDALQAAVHTQHGVCVAVEVCRIVERRHQASLHSSSLMQVTWSAVSDCGSGTIIVPMPSLVKTSSSNECGCRPSMMCACGTPSVTARTHASSLGLMPASTRVSRSAAALTDSCESSEDLSGQLAKTPSTSVRTTSLWALRATARAEAAVSELTLRTWPSASRSGATVETTGMRRRPGCP